jgi:diaminopimelate epimerase
MHALGNDFVVIDLITQHLILNATDIQRLTNRHAGIGCDQLLLINPPIRPDADFSYRIFNVDGSEAEQCGNGARCIARFFYDLGLSDKTHLLGDCLAGAVEFDIQTDNTVSVKLGYPNFIPFSNPFSYPVTLLNLGNPHAVMVVPDIYHPEILSLSKQINLLPECSNDGINVTVMQILNRSHIQLRVFERGVGETLACGSGACAAMIAGHQLGLLENSVTVTFRMGDLEVKWAGIQDGIAAPVFMNGPTTHVFMGQFRL